MIEVGTDGSVYGVNSVGNIYRRYRMDWAPVESGVPFVRLRTNTEILMPF